MGDFGQVKILHSQIPSEILRGVEGGEKSKKHRAYPHFIMVAEL